MTTARPVFYKPVFGNDNMMPVHDAIDLAAFSAPALRRRDVAAHDLLPQDLPPAKATV